MQNQRRILTFNGGPKLGVTFPTFERSCDLLFDPVSYPRGAQPLEPKIKYMFQGVETSKVQFKKDFPNDLCARVTFVEGSAAAMAPHKTETCANVRTIDEGKYIDLTVRGELRLIETAYALNSRVGIRGRGIESLIQRLAALTSARDGYLSLHGGAVLDRDGIVYIVADKSGGAGKTTLLLQMLIDGAEFISNNLRVKVEGENLILYPQHWPISNAALVRLRRKNYDAFVERGLNFNSLGVTTYSNETSPAPIGGSLGLLLVPTVRKPIVVTPETNLVAINPQASDERISVEPIIHKELRQSWAELAWRSTWDFDEIEDWFDPTPTSWQSFMRAVTKFQFRHINRSALERLADRPNHILKVYWTNPKILGAVREYVQNHPVTRSGAAQ